MHRIVIKKGDSTAESLGLGPAASAAVWISDPGHIVNLSVFLVCT